MVPTSRHTKSVLGKRKSKAQKRKKQIQTKKRRPKKKKAKEVSGKRVRKRLGRGSKVVLRQQILLSELYKYGEPAIGAGAPFGIDEEGPEGTESGGPGASQKEETKS